MRPVRRRPYGDSRSQWRWRTGALAAGLLSGAQWAWAQPPYLPIASAPVVVGPTVSAYPEPRNERLHDHYIGRHDMFYEPPPGYYARNTFGMMKAKADPHRFTLYRTDFLPGTTRLSPQGAMHFNLIASRLPGWLGPVVVEWSPDEPGMAEARRQAVLATLASTGQPVIPERVIIGPSPFPGTLGTDGGNYYNIMITRDTQAPSSYSLSPSLSGGSFSGGGGGGGAGGP
jgi:hypothetical protein